MFGEGLQLVAIYGTVNAIFSLIIALRLYISYKKTRIKAQLYFTKFYLYFGIFYLTFATSQLFFVSPELGLSVGIFHAVSYIFLYLSIGYLLSFPFMLTGRENTAKNIVIGMFVYNVIFFIIRIINIQPSEVEVFLSYSYWKPIFPEWMRLLTGIVSLGTSAFTSSLFFKHGVQNKRDAFVYRRSMWMGSGIAIFVLASIAAFIAAPSGNFIFVLAATFLVLTALLVILRGASLSRENESAESVA